MSAEDLTARIMAAVSRMVFNEFPVIQLSLGRKVITRYGIIISKAVFALPVFKVIISVFPEAGSPTNFEFILIKDTSHSLIVREITRTGYDTGKMPLNHVLDLAATVSREISKHTS